MTAIPRLSYPPAAVGPASTIGYTTSSITGLGSDGRQPFPKPPPATRSPIAIERCDVESRLHQSRRSARISLVLSGAGSIESFCDVAKTYTADKLRGLAWKRTDVNVVDLPVGKPATLKLTLDFAPCDHADNAPHARFCRHCGKGMDTTNSTGPR